MYLLTSPNQINCQNMHMYILSRLGEMCEVAGAVTFLASRDAAFVNATDLKVNTKKFTNRLISDSLIDRLCIHIVCYIDR